MHESVPPGIPAVGGVQAAAGLVLTTLLNCRLSGSVSSIVSPVTDCASAMLTVSV